MALTLAVTVAVCTAGRPESLERTLRSLLAQEPGPGEILVVNNRPDQQATAELLRREFPTVRVIEEPIPGLDFARNRALQAAQYDIVVYLDDDAIAQPGWAAAVAGPLLEDSRVGACTGRVEAQELVTEAQKLFEANGGFSRGTASIRLPRDSFQRLHGHRAPLIAWAVSVGSGCSLAVNRNAAQSVGGFDPALDLGPALPGGGDHDMLWRLLLNGFDIVYQPTAVARHEHRRELSAARDQIVGHQRALIALLTKHAVQTPGRGRWPVAAFLGWRLLKPGVRLARRLVGRDPLPVGLLLRMWVHCWRGLGAYPWARRVAAARAAGISA
jgi:glycosyltransferase involved in cell wall biosynthesis